MPCDAICNASADENQREKVLSEARQVACQIDPSARVCESVRVDSRDSGSFVRVGVPSKSLFGEMYAEIFLPLKSRARVTPSAFIASPRTLSSRPCGIVHECYDMEEMPNSQWFFRLVENGSRRRDGGTSARATPRSRRVGAARCDAAGARPYTFP
jgi:hypothetical protein